MTSNRANLENPNQNSTYLILAVILFILSAVGFILLSQIQRSRQLPPPVTDIAVTSEIPTSAPIDENIDTSAIPAPSTDTLSLTPSAPHPTTVIAKPTPVTQTYTSDTDKFTAVYKSSRKVYKDSEVGGTRYTFYSPQGNIALHVGNKWSWEYPDRQFSQSLLVSGYPTFIYEIDTQTIVDFQVGEKLFTIQCVHNSDAVFKSECQQFLSDFKVN
jgi:hypothetical protein